MKRLRAALAVVFVCALAAPAFAVDTVGTLVDLSCYKMDKTNTGLDHKMPKGNTPSCAVECAKKGMPLALITDKGEVFIVGGALAENNNARLVRHLGYKVSVQGSVSALNPDGTRTILGGALKRLPK